MGDPEAPAMARPLRAPLRRSFSDHIRDSTARALDVIWKNTRDRRLAGEGRAGREGREARQGKQLNARAQLLTRIITDLIGWAKVITVAAVISVFLPLVFNVAGFFYNFLYCLSGF